MTENDLITILLLLGYTHTPRSVTKFNLTKGTSRVSTYTNSRGYYLVLGEKVMYFSSPYLIIEGIKDHL